MTMMMIDDEGEDDDDDDYDELAVHNARWQSIPECRGCYGKRSCTVCLHIKMRKHKKIFRT